jgi:DNA-binding NtrC family response regulator
MDRHFRRFLVVEDEYLIGLDASGLLSQAFACEVELCTRQEAAAYVDGTAWDAVLLDTAGNEDDAYRANLIIRRGAALVFLTGYSHLHAGVPGYTQWPVVMKPFSRETLSESVARALKHAGKAR